MRADEATSLEQVKKSGGGGVERTGKRREGGSGNYDDGHRTTNNEGEEEEEGPAAAEEKREGGRKDAKGRDFLSLSAPQIPYSPWPSAREREEGRREREEKIPHAKSLLPFPPLCAMDAKGGGREGRGREEGQRKAAALLDLLRIALRRDALSHAASLTSEGGAEKWEGEDGGDNFLSLRIFQDVGGSEIRLKRKRGPSNLSVSSS